MEKEQNRENRRETEYEDLERPVRKRPPTPRREAEYEDEERPVRKRPSTQRPATPRAATPRRETEYEDEVRPSRRRSASEYKDEERPVRKRPPTPRREAEYEDEERPVRRRRPASEYEDEERPQRRRPATERPGTERLKTRQPASGRVEAEDHSRRKKNRGLLVFLTTILILLLIVLALCVWQLIASRNGGITPLSLLNGGKRNSEIPVLYSTEAPTTTAEETSEQENSGTPDASGAGNQGAGQTENVPAQTTEAPTYQNDENGNLIIPQQQPGTLETAPAWTSVLETTGDETLDTANRQAAMYDYDAAIATLQAVSGYESKQAYVDAIAEYEQKKSMLVPYSTNNKVTHIFFHTLAVDTSRCFDHSVAISKQDGVDKVGAYNEMMTTVDEFVRIIEEMYRRGFVLVDIHDIAGYTENADGTRTMQYKTVYLPEGKEPFVLSVDDVSYYEYMEGHGFAKRLVIGDDGKVTNELELADGSIIRGSYDVMPILEEFIETHPDFSYKGAKGIIALTGYEGVLGYRTCDYWYNWNCDYFKPDHAAKREQYYYNNDNIEQDKQAAKQVADAIKAQGWSFASHSWGHRDMGQISYEDLVWDTDMWKREVEPIVGATDVIIFPKGADIDSWRGYAADNQKFLYLKSAGFEYFCNVDSSQYWTQIGANKDYFRMGRRNLDGIRMWEALTYYQNPEGGAKDRVSDLFDARLVFDWSRPTPVE